VTIEEEPPVWFGQEVRVLAPADPQVGEGTSQAPDAGQAPLEGQAPHPAGGAETARLGVVRGVSRPWRDRPWSMTVEVDGEPDLLALPADRLVPTGWFRTVDGARISADQHRRETGPRPGDRLRRRNVTLTVHVEAGGTAEATARARETVAALGLTAVEADEPVEHWKVPGTWVVVIELAWPHDAGDDAEAAVTHLTAATGLDWPPASGTPEGADAVWSPGDVVDPRIPHVTWMARDGIA
jgi:hypothetical protein